MHCLALGIFGLVWLFEVLGIVPRALHKLDKGSIKLYPYPLYGFFSIMEMESLRMCSYRFELSLTFVFLK
jgi:hypothetical protein